MTDDAGGGRFAERLRDVSRSLDKKRYWSLVREELAALNVNSAERRRAIRAAANEVARLSTPSARIDLNGHSASSLLRAIADGAMIDPPALAGVAGRGPHGSVIAVSPFEPAEGLYAFAFMRKGEPATFVHGYFYRTANELIEWLSQKHGSGSLPARRMATFVSDAERAVNDGSLPSLADAIVARTCKGAG